MLGAESTSAGFKQLIKDKGFSQSLLAKRVGVSQVLVWKWTKGICQPQLGMVTKLSAVLSVPVEVIIKSFEIVD